MAIIARAGITKLTINGTPYDLRSNLTYSLNTLDRSAIIGMDGVHGYKDPPITAKMSFTITDSDSLGVITFQGMVNVAIEVQLRTGKRVLGIGMFSVGTQEVNAAEAEISCKFEGGQIIEIP